jgi:hypothetical protein
MVELVNEEFPLWIGCDHQKGEHDELFVLLNHPGHLSGGGLKNSAFHLSRDI